MGYVSGTDLILGVVQENSFKPLGYSASCKISDSSEIGERKTKEEAESGWTEKYVKSLSESIEADGFVYDDVAATKIGFSDLKSLWINKTIITLRYKLRNQGSSEGLYQGNFIIATLDEDGPAGDDAKWSVKFENSGAVTPVGSASQQQQS